MGKSGFKIEEYLVDIAEGKISISKLSRDTGVSRDTIYNRIQEYCQKNNLPNIYYGPKKIVIKPKINVSEYIEDLKNGRITKAEIARRMGVSLYVVNKCVKEYILNNNIDIGDLRKVITKIDMSKYIPDLEDGNIKISDIVKKEGVSRMVVLARINDYYSEIGQPRPYFNKKRKKKNIKAPSRKILKFDDYIEEYTIGFVRQYEIAQKEGITISGVNKAISRYYRKRFATKKISNSTNFDIQMYIEDYEAGIVTPHQIAVKEKIDIVQVNAQLRNYYKRLHRKVPMYGVPESLLLEYIQKGLTIEQIKEIASKKNIIIPNAAFEYILRKIGNREYK